MLIRHAMGKGAAWAAALVAVAGLPVLTGTTPATAAVTNGRIAYSHTTAVDSTSGDALSVAPTGGAPATISAGTAAPPVIANFPVYSPDGTKVVFIRGTQGGTAPLFLAAADGSAPVQLTQAAGAPPSPSADVAAGFSPDGKTVAFTRQVGFSASQVWVVDVATRVERRLGTSDAVALGAGGVPGGGGQVFSADGQHVVFGTPLQAPTGQVFRGRVSDGAVEQVTAFAGITKLPAYSPDGSRIAFGADVTGAPDDTCGVYSVPATATMVAVAGATPVSTFTPCTQVDIPAPVYSPNGATIAFANPFGILVAVGKNQVLVVPSAGGTATPVTAVPVGTTATLPIWSPDGTRIVYAHAAYPPGSITSVLEVVTVADAAHTASPITAGPIDVPSSWQRVQVATGNPCTPGSLAPAGYKLIVGTAGRDKLVGTSGRDLIRGLDGKDLIFGNGGSDILCGNDGADRIWGNRGSDLINGGRGNDTLSGSTGADKLLGGTGRDGLFGGHGNDQLVGGRGNDELLGGRGRDRLSGGQGKDVGVGGPGKDRIRSVEDKAP